MEDLTRILDDLTTQTTQVRSLSVERLAEFLCSALHLVPVKWLVRSFQSDGAEVQVLAQDSRLPPHRWLVQCVDAEYVDMDVIATAIGRGIPDNPHCLLTVTPGRIDPQARRYVTTTSASHHLPGFAIMLFDGEDMRSLAGNVTTIEDLIRRELNWDAAQSLSVTP